MPDPHDSVEPELSGRLIFNISLKVHAVRARSIAAHVSLRWISVHTPAAGIKHGTQLPYRFG